MGLGVDHDQALADGEASGGPEQMGVKDHENRATLLV